MLLISDILDCQLVSGVLYDFLLYEKMDQWNSIKFSVKNEIKKLTSQSFRLRAIFSETIVMSGRIQDT